MGDEEMREQQEAGEPDEEQSVERPQIIEVFSAVVRQLQSLRSWEERCRVLNAAAIFARAQGVALSDGSEREGQTNMATKHTDTCLQKAGDDEPIFVLRATDRLAPALVRDWAQRAETWGAPLSKVNEARELAARMEDWQIRYGSKVPD